MSDSVRILPLGGLGEIGKNMTVVEHDGRIVVVDTGADVPDRRDARHRPRPARLLDYLRERADDIEAIVLTHGHEDHVGALPYVLREIGLPPMIYGGPLTIGMVRSKLEEHKLRDAPLEVVEIGERIECGPFEIEMIHMSHSIPDLARGGDHDRRSAPCSSPATTSSTRRRSTALPADIARLAELGSEGLLCLLRRLDQRRPPGDRAVGVDRRPGAARGVRPLRGPDHRHLLRLQRASRPAGDRRRRPARPPGGPRRPLDAQELQHRLQPRNRERARRDADPAARDRGLPGPQGDRDLHRQPGRAALGAAPDGPRRPPRHRAPLRRHRRLLGDPGPRQRALGQRDDRPDLPDRREGDDGGGRADPRLRPRLAGGAEADAEPDQAPLRAARSTATTSGSACTASWPSPSGSTPSGSSAAETGSPWRSTSAGRGSPTRRPTRE